MKNKIKTPKLLSGSIYQPDDEDFKIFKPEHYKQIENDYEVYYKLERGNIVPNPVFDNEKIIFDFIGDDLHYGASFTGFLYSNNEFIGKIKWIKDANLPDEDFRGYFKKITKKGIVLYGKWADEQKLSYNVVVVLKSSNK